MIINTMWKILSEEKTNDSFLTFMEMGQEDRLCLGRNKEYFVSDKTNDFYSDAYTNEFTKEVTR